MIYLRFLLPSKWKRFLGEVEKPQQKYFFCFKKIFISLQDYFLSPQFFLFKYCVKPSTSDCGSEGRACCVAFIATCLSAKGRSAMEPSNLYKAKPEQKDCFVVPSRDDNRGVLCGCLASVLQQSVIGLTTTRKLLDIFYKYGKKFLNSRTLFNIF